MARSPTPRSRVADATLYPEDTATTLAQLGFSTRMPGTLKLVSQVIPQALPGDRRHCLDETTRYDGLALGPNGMAQRGRVVSSQAAMARAEASSNNAPQRAWEGLETPLLHWHAKRFETPEAAQAALAVLATSWRYHQVDTARVIAHKHDTGTGRPPPRRPSKSIVWQIHAPVRPDQERIECRKQQGAGFVIGTNSAVSPVSAPAVLQADKAQAQAEGGFRFLNAPLCFVSSLFVKTPYRSQGLLMVMTLALLV